MSSKYYEWLARNEKPEEPRELTPAEKRKNWWFYHKWFVLLGVLLAAIAVDILWSNLSRPQPDYRFAYVGSNPLPDDTVSALQAALEELGEDANGDGKTAVEIVQYVSGTDFSEETASQVTLVADIVECESYFFLLENPEDFQQMNHALRYLDGTLPPEDAGAEGTFLLWSQCPVLAGLELGDYASVVLGQTATGRNQDVLVNLAFARRGFWTEKTVANLSACDALWEILTEGAEKP